MNARRTSEAAALVALLRRTRGLDRRPLANLLEDRGSALALLDDQEGGISSPLSLFENDEVQDLLDTATADIDRWESEGMRMLSVLDPGYPANLRAVHDRPPMVFVAGALTADDDRAVAVIGSRRASSAGLAAARAVSEHLVDRRYTVVSGLAAGIDTAAHTAALEAGGRSVAVIGTGLRRCYPVANTTLQRRIAGEGAVVSQFWPDDPPSRRSFPARNAVMSGMALATVIVEASVTSGARVQARLALAHGRPVFVHESMLERPWARELSAKPATHVFKSATEITEVLERLDSGALVA